MLSAAREFCFIFMSYFMTVIHKCVGGKEKPKYSETKISRCQLFCHKFHMIGLGRQQGLRDGQLLTAQANARPFVNFQSHFTTSILRFSAVTYNLQLLQILIIGSLFFLLLICVEMFACDLSFAILNTLCCQ